ncbi:MAG: hypothetical protein QHJ82_01445 [Verrucomicrobiota bacterium]|nr:hypothetical protein [Verrucomicrobiota bacterium]
MKTTLACGVSVLLVCSLMAGEQSPKDIVTAAARSLADKPNYSWKTTVKVPEGSQWRPGPTEGKTEKDGFTYVTYSFGDNKIETVLKGEKAAATTPDGWQSLSELENSEGPTRFFARMLRSFKAPAAQAIEIVFGVKELKKTEDFYSGDLTDEQAKALMTFRSRGATGEGPTVSNAKGAAKFWVKDGLLSKYEFAVKGTMTWNNNDIDVDRTTTVEIKEVGTTKLSVPEEAKKKLL